MLNDVRTHVRHGMWLQHDGALSHYVVTQGYARHDNLGRTFGNNWIRRDGPVAWPPRSPNLSSLDYFLWGATRSTVYDTAVNSEMDLVARISIAAATISETPNIFENVRQSMWRRCRACIHASGRHFENQP